ncbi:carbon-nitrogen hydrolase family protein [Pseudomonas koreensis]|uniref:carbon-nitrogen hydrolase family protein n=1 Tax=Pseudomonas koreensis TaxID=198620 RepID=UPI003F68A039
MRHSCWRYQCQPDAAHGFHAARPRAGVGLLLFPELSLTGYEPTLAKALAQDIDSPLLSSLRHLAREASMTTVVGLSLRRPSHDKPLISAFILHPDGSIGIHTKQHLHLGEEQYFSAGNGGDLILVADLPVALSVCADFSHPEHSSHAAKQAAQLYATSVLIGETGYSRDSLLLQNCSKAAWNGRAHGQSRRSHRWVSCCWAERVRG